MISLKHLQDKLPAITNVMFRTKWIWAGLAIILALRFYYVREMIAALMIFSVLFAAGALLVLAVILLDRVSQQIAVWAEAGAHWVGAAAEALFARPMWAHALPHRFRKELKHSEKI